MPAKDVVIRGAGITSVAAVLIGGGAYIVGGGGGGGSDSANVWLASDGATSCTRSSSEISYTDAVSGGNVCRDLQDACAVTVGGDTITAKTGYYPIDYSSYAGEVHDDCSNGSGSAVNPNAAEQGVGTGTTADWVTLQGEGGCAARSIVFSGTASVAAPFIFHGDLHLIVDGGATKCFFFRSPWFGEWNVDGTLTTQNVQVLNSYLDGFRISGAKNILLSGVHSGPSIACAGSGEGASAEATCKANGDYFEEPWRSAGRANYEGFNGKISENAGNPSDKFDSINVRLEHSYMHDHETRDEAAPGTEWHTEGLLIQWQDGAHGDPATDSHNIVLDDLQFERNAIFEIFTEDSSGWTLQNSTLGCPTDSNTLQSSENWGDCASAQPSVSIKQGGGTVSNVLIRYNAFFNNLLVEETTLSNVRVYGNIFHSNNCPGTSGMTFARNAYWGTGGSTCGTNAVDLGATDPWVDTSYGTDWTNTPETDYHLTTAAAALTTLTNAITETSSDYALTTDMDGDGRASGSRTIGPDER